MNYRSWRTYDLQRPNDRKDVGRLCRVFDWHADQQTISSSQVFARAECDAQNAHGTLYKTRVGLDTPRDVVFSNDHLGSILALNGANWSPSLVILTSHFLSFACNPYCSVRLQMV